jgi:hypothetical protein
MAVVRDLFENTNIATNKVSTKSSNCQVLATVGLFLLTYSEQEEHRRPVKTIYE